LKFDKTCSAVDQIRPQKTARPSKYR